MRYLTFLLNKFYSPLKGTAILTKVMDSLTRLYNLYKVPFSRIFTGSFGDQTSVLSQSDVTDGSDVCQSQREQHLEDEINVDNKSDLEKYLMDTVEKNKDLNILAGWKVSSERYLIVSKIARDMLAIPVSTVASESTFSTGDQILDSYCSSLLPKTVEALICCQQWLPSTSHECKLEDLLEEIQKVEIVEKEYPDTILSIDLFGS